MISKRYILAALVQKDGLTIFEFSEGTKIMTGNLNYERGLGNDENATVYVLNSDKPESEQKKFVKFSGKDSSVFSLNGEKVDQTYQLIAQ